MLIDSQLHGAESLEKLIHTYPFHSLARKLHPPARILADAPPFLDKDSVWLKFPHAIAAVLIVPWPLRQTRRNLH